MYPSDHVSLVATFMFHNHQRQVGRTVSGKKDGYHCDWNEFFGGSTCMNFFPLITWGPAQRKISVLRRLVQKRVFYNIHFWKQHVANHAPWTFSAGWYAGTEARPVVGAGTKWWRLKEVKNQAHIGVFGWLVQLGWITNCLSWERYVPPPFLDVWEKFFDLLQRNDRTSANFDQIIPQLLPTFYVFQMCTQWQLNDVQ